MRGIGKSQENSTIFPLFFQQAVSKESPTFASGGGIASRTAFFTVTSDFSSVFDIMYYSKALIHKKFTI